MMEDFQTSIFFFKHPFLKQIYNSLSVSKKINYSIFSLYFTYKILYIKLFLFKNKQKYPVGTDLICLPVCVCVFHSVWLYIIVKSHAISEKEKKKLASLLISSC